MGDCFCGKCELCVERQLNGELRAAFVAQQEALKEFAQQIAKRNRMARHITDIRDEARRTGKIIPITGVYGTPKLATG
jgi:hypothetical protein